MTEDTTTLKKVVAVWPIVLTAAALTISAASASTRLDELKSRVDYIWDNGSPTVSVRLARMEEKQNQMNEKLDRIEQKLDNDYVVSPEAKKKLRKL